MSRACERRSESGRQCISHTSGRQLERGEMGDGIRRAQRLERPNRQRQLPDIAGPEVPLTVVQPDPDGFSGKGRADDNVEIVVVIDVSDADRDRLMTRFECDVVRRLSGDRKLEAIHVAVRVPSDIVGNGHVGLAVRVEIANNGRPPKRLGGISESECRTIGPNGSRSSFTRCRNRSRCFCVSRRYRLQASRNEQRECGAHPRTDGPWHKTRCASDP
jgi:hypothetical protein